MNLNGVLKLEEAILPYEGNEYYYSKERLHYCNDLESVLEMSKSHTMYRINLYVGGKQILGILPSKIKKSFIMKNNKRCVIQMQLVASDGEELQLEPKKKDDVLVVYSYTNTQTYENQLGCTLKELRYILNEYRILIEECGDCFDTEVEKQFFKDIGLE